MEIANDFGMRRSRPGLITCWVFIGFLASLLRAGNDCIGAQGTANAILCTQSPRSSDQGSIDAFSAIEQESRIVRIKAGQPAEVMTSSFVAASRARVSFEGDLFLFVGRKSHASDLAVWEIGVDGQGLREVVSCEGNCLQAEYLSTLYSLGDETPSRRIVFTCQPRDDGPPQLFTSRLDGADRRQITFLPTGAIDPVALSDGRLWFRSPGRTDSYIVQTDGTDLSAFGSEDQKKFGVDRPGGKATIEGGRTVESRWLEESKSWGIVSVDATDGNCVVLLDTENNERDPVVIGPRPQPSGHSSVVRDAVDAELFCLDSAIVGEKRSRGAAVRLQLWTATPMQNSKIPESLLGEFSIEEDGSFFIEVPPRTPFRLDLLGQNGEPVGSMKSWTWVMPGERRGCIGCHENPLMTPPNRHVLALRKPAQKLRSAEGANSSERPMVRGGTNSQP